ncbi:NADH-quinone oxidoreductase subunit L [Urbifossiella limnaea]|uniref:NADH-quinone oxidoreductase subunit L n=1 Tax=Urbifossiella limnaea TaxID=2528023 RepID=UPI0011A64F72|nr:NADH-quinone oxidoreductase subunit L [Urbifossiella limnaea]
MSDPVTFALTVLALLLGAAVLTALFSGAKALTSVAHVPLVIACGLSALLAIFLVSKVAGADTPQFVSAPVTWFAAGKFAANFTIAVDPLSAMMLAMITFIATFIAVFSSGYMRGEHGEPDAGYVRYFAVMSLFVFCMCGLVLANNFLLLVGFWEGVGLCSYLLVGYYYDKPSAAAAARKAFLVTRLGDTGFLLGIMLLWKLGGWHTDLTALFDHIAKNPPPTEQITAACLLLFCGAVGKSAQFPLYVWLPDAMEGPTPVSALIHAATMVTAGVYLVARCAPLFALAPDAQAVVAWAGGITALLAAFIALAQTDLKRVLAYSTVSQLGFMFLALGTLGAVSPVFAVVAAMFHLFTHAFFKALLFLASGSVMHAMGNVIDMRRFGGLRTVMPTTHLTFLCGAAALAGLPLLSGFWSKDLVLESLQFGAHSGHPHAGSFYLLMLVAMLTAGLTAFYTFRAYFLTFWGPTVVPEEAGHHAHESPSVMTVPLIVLAAGALFVGIVAEPFTHWFSGFVGRTPSIGLAAKLAGAAEVAHHFNWGIAGVSTLLAVGGVALAYMAYGAGGPERVPVPLAGVFALSRNKLYVDEVYEGAFVKPAEWLAVMARVFDLLLDSVSRVIAAVPRLVGVAVRPIQNGLVQFYALSMALGLAVFLSFVVFRAGR